MASSEEMNQEGIDLHFYDFVDSLWVRVFNVERSAMAGVRCGAKIQRS